MAGTDLTVKIGGDAAGLVAATNKAGQALDGLTDNMDAAARAASKVGASTKDLGEVSGRTGQAAAKLAGALGMVSPQAAEAARAVNDLADVGEVAAEASKALGLSVGATLAIVGTVAAVVGAAYLVWNSYQEEEERVARTAKEVQQAHEDLAPVLESTRDALIDLEETTGKLTEEQAALKRNAIEVHQRWDDATKGTRKRLQELRREQESVGTQIADWAVKAAGYFEIISPGLSAAVDMLTTGSKDMQAEVDALDKEVEQSTETLDKNKAATEAVIKADHKSKAAKEARTKAIEAENKAFQDQLDLLKLEEQAANERAQVWAQEDADALARQQQFNATSAKLAQERFDAEDEAIINQIAAQREAAEQTQATALSVTESVGSIFGSVADMAALALDGAMEKYQAYGDKIIAIDEAIANAQSDSEKRRLQSQRATLKKKQEAEKDAALKAFKINKTAALVQAGISTSLAIVNAAATVPFVPAGIIAMVAAGIAGAVQIAAIASQAPPQFHSGGLVGRGLATAQGNLATGVMANVLPGEGVVTRRGMDALGQDGLESLNQGGGAGGPTTIIYSHQDRILAHQVADLAREGVPGFRNQPKAKAGRVNLYAPRAA